MVFRTLSGLLFSLLVSAAAHAQTIQVNPSHPEHYTVAEGDTLWDIAGKFLQHPWQWPELWRYNQQIQNPHLIYPGDTIHFSIVNGTPQLSLTRNGEISTGNESYRTGPCVLEEKDFVHGRDNFALSDDGKVLPCVRVVPLKQAIEMIPAEDIRPFLSSPKVVGKDDMNNAPYVIEIAGEHITAGAGDRVYVRPGLPSEQTSYTIYRPGNPYVRPETQEILGYEADYVADASLQQAGNPSTLTIDKSNGDIRRGDRLMPTRDETIALQYFPRPPEKPLTGTIISVLGGVSQIGRNNVVVIDRGSADGLLPGHELEILRRGEIVRDPFSSIKNDAVKLPDEHAGVLMVFRPFEKVSYALVMKATQAIHILDVVKTP